MNIGPDLAILVTGGSGFIGSHVCDALVDLGAQVTCMDNFATSDRKNVEHLQGRKNFRLIEGDIRSVDDCRNAIAGNAIVVHLAALGSVPRSIADPLASHATNLTAFLNVLESSRIAGVKKLIYASSSSVYGDSKELPKKEERIGLPLSPYAVTKAGNEAYATLYHRLHSFPSIGLRFFNVFGERQDPDGPYAAAIPKFIRSFLAHRSPQVHGDGLQSRDFTYVGNAVQAVIAAIESRNADVAGRIFNIAYGSRTTLLELIGLLQRELAQIDPTIASIQVKHVAPRAGDVRDSLADIGLAKEMLGFKPAYTLVEGLKKAVPWYVRNYR